MFRTVREAELMRGLINPAKGFQFWSHVELETVWPWFHVETIDNSHNDYHRGIILAPNVQLLIGLLDSSGKDSWVNEVQVITPASMNGSSSWRMEILEAMHEVINVEGVICGYEYQVPNGTIYSMDMNDEPGNQRRLKYSAINHM